MAAKYYDLNDVFDDVRYVSSKDSNTLLDTDLIRIANKYYGLIFRELVDLKEDIYTEISSTDLEQDQREYPLPVDSSSTGGGGLVKLQRVEITYDGSTWRVADPISFQQISTPTILDTDINSAFDRTDPKYTFKDRSLFLFPVPSSSDSVANGNAGLRIFWVERNVDLDATTDVPDMPLDFLSVLSDGILIDVFRKYGRMTDADRAKQDFELGISRIRALEAAPDEEMPYVFKHARKNYK